MNNDNKLDGLVLGKHVSYSKYYDPTLLQAVPRSLSRKEINLPSKLPFTGIDIWNAYELSWLNTKGKPIVAILRCFVPIDSANLIESKSFKMYLNSFNQSRFSSSEEVQRLISKDLSDCASATVTVELIKFDAFKALRLGELPGVLIDDIDVLCDETPSISPNLLETNEQDVQETLCSHLLKSNCLITNQPDWGSVMIKYSGKQIEHSSLLQYIVSFRQHNEFHEQCVERIFYDILKRCKPHKLTVYARYTRRGGLDINPFRSNFESPYPDMRLARQ